MKERDAPLEHAADQDLYRAVQQTLIGGMVLSFGLMGLGLLGLLINPQAGARAETLVPLDRLPDALLALDPPALLDTGVLVLMFIPVVHLTVTLITFVRRHEPRYAVAAAVVLLLLAGSAVLALAH